MFLQCCEYENLQPTIQNFVSWQNQRVVNPNFNFQYDLIFKIFLGLKCYRARIRHNNSQHAMAGRQAITPLMFIGNHLIYQTILLNDMKGQLEAPKEVYDFMTGNKSFSRSGDEYRGEGGDYITENKSKHIKGHLGPGVPTLQHWIRASRNHEKLQANCATVFERAGLKDLGLQSSSIFKFDIQVQMLRAIIRDSSILDDPYSQLPLKAPLIDGTPLHHDLVNFMFTAMENYNTLTENPEADLQPVFVTYKDENIYNDVKTWTVEKICKNIEIILNGMNNIETAAEYSSYKETKTDCILRRVENDNGKRDR